LADALAGTGDQRHSPLIDIRQGEAGETSKPVPNQFGRELVAAARQNPRLGAISRVHAGRTQRDHSNIDVIHERDACFLGPLKGRKSSNGRMRVLRRLPEKIRQYVVMGVDGQRFIWMASHAILCF
jgi:hypothetical protein